MIIFVDIDETICSRAELSDWDYSKSFPFPERIEKINGLYEEGNTIVYWTARGTMTGKTWFKVTESQLNEWGCKYHELRMGKPYYDLFIDDRNINSDVFFKSTSSYNRPHTSK